MCVCVCVVGRRGSKAMGYPTSEFQNKILIIQDGYLECGTVTHLLILCSILY